MTSPTPRRGDLRLSPQEPGRALGAAPGTRQRIADDPRLRPLLSAVAAGDRNALAAIYDLLVSEVLAVVRSLVDDEDAVEHVVVETFSRLWQQAPRIPEVKPHVNAWVLLLAVQCARERRRSRGGRT